MNLNYQFYRAYYDGVDPRQNAFPKKDRETVEARNEVPLSTANDRLHRFTPRSTSDRNQIDLSFYHPGASHLTDVVNVENIALQTTYPGLIIGIGYNHETMTKDEITIGFHFDHTTGLPCIPGSTVKGVLRSAFPQRYRNKYSKQTAATNCDLIRSCLNHLQVPGEWTDDKIDDLELNIFAGHRDVFLDAFVSSATENRRLVGPDFITPHPQKEKPTEEPNPIRLLKVLPGVSFKFQFKLSDYVRDELTLPANRKRDLFRLLLLMRGVGAKTNVGYGRLVDSNSPDLELPYLSQPSENLLPVIKPTTDDWYDARRIDPKHPPEVFAIVLRGLDKNTKELQLFIKGLNTRSSTKATLKVTDQALPINGTYVKVQIEPLEELDLAAPKFLLKPNFFEVLGKSK